MGATATAPTRCQWCGVGTRGRQECAACRRGGRTLDLGLWDPQAVHELTWDAGLAWSPIWTLVPDVGEASQADVDYATRQQRARELDLQLQAEWKAQAEAAKARVERDRAAQKRVAAANRAREARLQAETVGHRDWQRSAPIMPTEPVAMEPVPGAREFRHAMPVSGQTCITERGAAQCRCGFYRMTWTHIEDVA
jgi:hypothetical protein